MQPFNKYFPPDWTPEKGSVNKFIGKHPLGDRARKIDQGILVVRFELPFNIWCTGCDNHNHEYVVVDGAKRKVEEWKEEDTEVMKLQDEETKEKLETDPIYRLEHGVKDKNVQQESLPVLTQLQHLQETQWSDPYTRSQQLRRKFREQKKKDKVQQDETDKLRDKHSLHIELLPESSSDRVQAKMVEYADPTDIEQRKLEKSASGLFAKSSSSKDLGVRAAMRTRLKTDPFLHPSTGLFRNNESKLDNVMVRPNKKIRTDSQGRSSSSTSGLVPYASSSDDDDDDEDKT
ncbi:hypothetical protein BJV82DRAFT_641741 [Fennellomyces sp. T-0311]|nr:hypothetical protein BJV82DRAFT_641741 [Fennellomyces sp. T-0311]